MNRGVIMYQEDFLMRQIEDIGRMLSILLFGKASKADFIQEAELYQTDEVLRDRLKELLDQGQVDEAENILFEALEETPSKEHFAAALSFYRTLSEWDDEKLQRCNFSYEEVLEGLEAVKRLYMDEGLPL